MSVDDFRLENDIETEVSRSGAATTTRKWTITDVGQTDLNLAWNLFTDLTDFHANLTSARDTHNKEVKTWRGDPGEGYLRLGCDFDEILRVGETYWVELVYEQANYFLHLPKGDCWVVDEWFYRSPLETHYAQEEPESWRFKLHVPDTRCAFFWVRNPTQSFHMETCPTIALKRDRGGVSLSWRTNLRPGERSEKLYVLHMRRSRLDPLRLLSLASRFLVPH